MFVFVVAEPGKESGVTKKIEAKKLGPITARDSNQIVVKINNPPKSKIKKLQLENEFKAIRGVLRVSLVQEYLNVIDASLKEALLTNRCVFFFDIDSTLTQGDPGIIHHKIESIFNKMVDKGIRIFFATGRSMPDLSNLIQKYPVENYAIAENGGILLGFGTKGYFEFGEIKEPNKVLSYLQTKYGIPEDMRQGTRLTEVIFLQKDVSNSRLNIAVKSTKAQVDIHPSKNSFHISKRGINKGTAMLELCNLLHFNNRMIISVGDADMDIPMLEKADYSFAVGNASPGAKKAAKKVLKGKFEKGIEEIFNLINRV